jgi:hypothetical protein
MTFSAAAARAIVRVLMVAVAAMSDVCHREMRRNEGSSSGSDSAGAGSISSMQRWLSPVVSNPVVMFSRRASQRFHPTYAL